MALSEKLMGALGALNLCFTISTLFAWGRNPSLLSYRRFETYPVMALQFCMHLFIWFVWIIFFVERVLVKYMLQWKDQGIFYRSLKSNLLLTYAILIYLSDEAACQCIPDFFVYIFHFTFYTTMASFKCVLDKYCMHVLESQISYDLIPEAQAKIRKIRVYYRVLKYVQIAAIMASFYLFSEVDKLRLYCLYTPGIKVIIDWFLSYENLYYKYKTTMSINEKVITWSLNYCFALNTLAMFLQMGNYFLIFFKTGISITFSFIHMYYMMRNFRFLFGWIKECEKFFVFHKYKRLITNKFKLKVFSNTKEECAICLNTLEKARELSCGHHFHLIWLLQLIKNGDKKWPVCRHPFEEQEPQPENVNEREQEDRPLLPAMRLRRNINRINFYGLEED